MEILTCFCCLLSDAFFQIICIVSFNFNLNSVAAESIISKQFSVLSDLQVSLLAIRFQILLNPCWHMASCLTNVTGITAWTNKLINNKGFQRLWNWVFHIKHISNFKWSQNNLNTQTFPITFTKPINLTFYIC